MISEHKQPLVKNAANKEQVKSAEYKQKRGRELEIDDVRSILSTQSGRRFMWRYMGELGLFRSSFVGHDATFYNEGRRSAALMMLLDINEGDPAAYLKMLEESKAGNL